MGVKIKAGMALGGILLSWMFGLNFLSGIASTVDSTGNVLVDIADGIGLVSKASDTDGTLLLSAEQNVTFKFEVGRCVFRCAFV